MRAALIPSKAVVLKLRCAGSQQVLMENPPFHAGQLQRPFPRERGTRQVLEEPYLRTTALAQLSSVVPLTLNKGRAGRGVRSKELMGECEQGDKHHPTTWATPPSGLAGGACQGIA